MRDRLSKLLVETGLENSDFYVLSGDHGYALFDRLREKCPTQFVNTGIAEQSTVAYAAGMSKMGLRVLVYGLASFIPTRVLEFIKMDVVYDELPVIFLGDGAGLVYSTLGSSHQSGEDIAVLRSMPNLRIYSPCDEYELDECYKRAVRDKKNASYIRIGKSDRPIIHNINSIFDDVLIKLNTIKSNSAIIATGSMVSTALTLAEEKHLSCYSAPFISDLYDKGLSHEILEYKNITVIEEHCTDGGLGSIIAELLQKSAPSSIHFRNFGLNKKFTTIASDYERALSEHGLTLKQLRDLV